MAPVSVFEASDYKEFLKNWLLARPKGGRGESRKIAAQLGVSTTLVSQVLNGDKHFTMEAASDLCDYLALSERETDHFLLLVDYARAGSHGLRLRLKRRIDQSRKAAQKLSVRLEKDRDLSDSEIAVYYSHWTYTGVRNLIATAPEIETEQIAKRLNMPLHTIVKVMSFLIESGILVQNQGRYESGAKRTHLGADSPLVVKHHQNWRLQGFNRMNFAKESDLFYTAPMSLSNELAERVRADLPAFIENIVKLVGPSPSEVVRCLNIDWFEF